MLPWEEAALDGPNQSPGEGSPSWDAPASILALADLVLYFPGGRAPLVARSTVEQHLPPDMGRERERIVLEAFLGVAAGVLTIVVARLLRGQRWLYSLGLLTLPSLYALFALQAGEPAVDVREMIYGIPFLVVGLVFAMVSVRRSAVVVGAFWILHGLYDLIHRRLITNTGVPGWYPVWCFSVDVVVGAYLLWLSRRLPDANLRRAI